MYDALANADLGCEPECMGSCFAGRCLFADTNLDEDDSFGSKQSLRDTASSSSRFASSVAGLAPIPGVPNFLHQQALPEAPVAAESDIHSRSTLESKAQELSYELQRAEAHEDLLKVQNEQLRQQLEQWKATGANIADREAQVVALLSKSPPQQNTPLSNTVPVDGARVATPSLPSMLQHTAQQQKTGHSNSYSRNVLIAVAASVILACVWKMGHSIKKVSKGEESWVSKAPAVLHAMGLAQFKYKVEVSEIHLGSLFAGSNDVRAKFLMGNGVERRTKLLKNSNGTFLRFDDILELSVSSSDAPCSICITDRRGDLAHVELTSSELVRLATRPHQEYFRTELTTAPALENKSDRRPYIAMKIRNIMTTSVVTTGASGKGEAAERQISVYGSFAV